MSDFIPTEKDRAGIDALVEEINKHSDMTIKVRCFSEEESEWITSQLLKRGVERNRFFTTWLEFNNPQPFDPRKIT